MRISRRGFFTTMGAAAGAAGLNYFSQNTQAEQAGKYIYPLKGDCIRVALIKANPQQWDLEYNWKLFEVMTRTAAERGAQIVCSSECFLDGYVVTDKENFTQEKFKGISQSLNGSYVTKACGLARELRIYAVFCFTELAENGSYNCAALIDDAGKIVGVYHKTHLDPESHDKEFLAGEGFSVWQTKLGPIGIMICADRRWPESARTLKVLGAKIIMNPTFGMAHYANEWWMRTRSYENELYICFTHPEVSLITNPAGDIDAKLQSNIPDILVHDISLKNVGDKMFKMRRPEIYKIK